MRFLKNKILLVQKLDKQKQKFQKKLQQAPKIAREESQTSSGSQSPTVQKRRRSTATGVILTPEKIRCTKNIAKNYGGAISAFACSPTAIPYLMQLLEGEPITLDEFMAHAKLLKKNITGIDSFRNALLIKDSDSPTNAALKRVFQKISEIFIKYFSVNWIFTARISHKLIYLKYRGKMLRRIQSPELFTYMKS